MSDTLGSAYVDIVARTKEFPGQLRDGLRSAGRDADSAGADHGNRYVRGLASRLKDSPVLGAAGKAAGVAIAGGIGVAAAGVGVALKVGFGEVKDYQAGLSQLAAGIKSTGGAAGVTAPHLEDLASKIQRYSGQTDDSIVASEKLLLTFTNIKNNGPNKIFDEATKASADLAARMGGDASASAIQLGKALNDPVKGITALTRVGVSFSEEQKKTIAAMVKTGDVAGAQKVILGELNKEFGGSAEAFGKTLPGQMEIAHRAFEDISQQLVTALLPAFTSMLTFATNDLLPGLGKLGSFLADTLGPPFRTITLAVVALFASMRDGDVTSDGLVGSFEKIGSFIHDNLIPAAKSLSTFFTTTLLPAFKQTASFVAAELVVAFGIGSRFVRDELLPVFRTVATFVVQNVIPAMRGLASFFVETVVPVVVKVATVVGDTLRKGFEVLSKKIEENRPQLEQLVSGMRTIATFILEHVVPIVARLAGYLAETLFVAIGKAIGIIGALVTAFNGIRTAVSGAVTFVHDKVNSLVTFFDGLPGRIRSAVSGMFDGIKDAFRNAINYVIDKWNGLEFTIGGQKVFGHELPGVTIGTPNIPHLATGGIIPARPGGTLVLIGEAGRDEAVVPLPRDGADALSGTQKHYHLTAVASEVRLDEQRAMELFGRMELLYG